jgi:hypothetical protein
MTNKVSYAVWPERGNLVRFSGGKAELYCPNAKGEDGWVEMPHLNEIRYGLGNAVYYDEIDEREARAWMDKLRNG